MRELEIYIHIPFCIKKCAYCDFLSYAADTSAYDAYVEALLKEIEEFEGGGDVIVPSVFIGGGTPSILKGQEILRIMERLREKVSFTEDAEITIEANPGTLTEEKLHFYKKAGINRVSIGLQSAQDEELKLLGRIHTYEEFLQSYHLARQSGFENINIDLMSGLPGQTLEKWEDTLQKVTALEPEHISAYGLIVEEGTPFFERYGEDAAKREKGEMCLLLPSEETERQMYERTGEILEGAGYARYEISNYAKTGYACRHNCGYWTRREYRGFGLGAASLAGGRRYQNTTDMKRYLAGQRRQEEAQSLTREEQMEETMFLGLRMMQGVSKAEFAAAFSVSMEEVYGTVLEKMEELGLLCEEKGRIMLTKRGIDVSNYVFSEFLLNG